MGYGQRLSGLVLQDRLVKELALAEVATVAAASAFIRDLYLPVHNARFAVTAEQEGSAFVAIPGVQIPSRTFAFYRLATRVGFDRVKRANSRQFAPAVCAACVRISPGKDEGCSAETFHRVPEGSTPSRQRRSPSAGNEPCMGDGNAAREA